MTTKKPPAKRSPMTAPIARKPRKSKAALPAKRKAPAANEFQVAMEPGGPTRREQLIAMISVNGDLANAGTVVTYSQGVLGAGDITQAVESLRETIKASRDGSTAVADRLLIGQAVALNAIFSEMMRRASLNLGEFPEAVDLYMRYGLRAQNQCRSTLESLSKIKNPATVSFVKQANIANGPQQVNNGSMSVAGQAAARTTETGSEPIELLESGNGEWVVNGAADATGARDPAVEAVGAVDRTEDK